MTRSELVNRLQSRFPNLTIKDVTAVVNVILDAVTETLAADDRVEIRGFGSFKINSRPPRVGRNPKTGETVMVPAKVAPHFKPGKELRERVETNK
jgi:integration host factor subunit beta